MRILLLLCILLLCAGCDKPGKGKPNPEEEIAKPIKCPYDYLTLQTDTSFTENELSHTIIAALKAGIPVKVADLTLQASDSVIIRDLSKKTQVRRNYYTDSTLNAHNALINLYCNLYQVAARDTTYRKDLDSIVFRTTAALLMPSVVERIPKQQQKKIKSEIQRYRRGGREPALTPPPKRCDTITNHLDKFGNELVLSTTAVPSLSAIDILAVSDPKYIDDTGTKHLPPPCNPPCRENGNVQIYKELGVRVIALDKNTNFATIEQHWSLPENMRGACSIRRVEYAPLGDPCRWVPGVVSEHSFDYKLDQDHKGFTWNRKMQSCCCQMIVKVFYEEKQVNCK